MGERATPRERFDAKIVRVGECWLWTGQVQPNGYGRFAANGRQVFAHRWSYEHFVGPIPDGFEVDHVKSRGCVHRHCVRPEHLEAVTHEENMRRSRRAQCINGHQLVSSNIYTYRGKRLCRSCRRVRNRRTAVTRGTN